MDSRRAQASGASLVEVPCMCASQALDCCVSERQRLQGALAESCWDEAHPEPRHGEADHVQAVLQRHQGMADQRCRKWDQPTERTRAFKRPLQKGDSEPQNLTSRLLQLWIWKGGMGRRYIFKSRPKPAGHVGKRLLPKQGTAAGSPSTPPPAISASLLLE